MTDKPFYLKRMIKRYLPFIPLALVALFWLAYPFFANGQPTPPVFPHGSLTIQRADGQQISLAIEIAQTPEQDAFGLMFRRSLPANAGMLFIADPERPMAMWMKNTYIPLDMLFIRHDGSIANIVTHAVPFDLTPLGPNEPVKGVIEINGGAAEKLGIKIGDKVLYPAFN